MQEQRTRSILLTAATLAILAPAGCAYDQNRASDLPVEVSLSSLEGSDTPSIEGSSRSNWALRSVSPVDAGVAHQPTYRWEISVRDPGHRAAGRFPTEETAVDSAFDHGGAAVEGLAALPLAFWDLLSAPVRMLFEPPWSTVISRPKYERTPTTSD